MYGMSKFALALAVVCSILAARAEARPVCPPAGYDRAALAGLKAQGWRIENDATRNAFARAIVPCLGSRDPGLRDGVAYEALYTLLRGKSLSIETMNGLYTDLMAMLQGSPGKGFAKPFAALALSEVARADRIEAFLTPAQRAVLLQAAIDYLTTVDDYRGFDEKEGWRHGVAHGADLMLQLALNPALGKEDLARIRNAIGAQIAPEGHSYVFGESERLARPVLYMAQRAQFTEAEWTAWLAGAAAIEGDAFATAGGLARRHNLTAFFSALYVNVKLGENTADDALLPGLEAAIRALP